MPSCERRFSMACGNLKAEHEDLLYSARHFGSSTSAPAPELVVEYAVPPIPQIRRVRKEGLYIGFEVTCRGGKPYRVESRTEAASGTWTTETNGPAGAGTGPIAVSLPLDAEQRFYRVVVD